MQGMFALLMCSIGYDALVFSVYFTLSKSTTIESGSYAMFSKTVPKRMALKISGSLDSYNIVLSTELSIYILHSSRCNIDQYIITQHHSQLTMTQNLCMYTCK